MGAAVTERHAKALRGTHNDVGIELTGRREKGEAQQVGGEGDQRSRVMCRRNGIAIVVNLAVRGGVLQEHAKNLSMTDFMVMIAYDDLHPSSCGAGPNHGNGLWMTILRHEKRAAITLSQAQAHSHRFGGGGRFVEQRGVSDFHSR